MKLKSYKIKCEDGWLKLEEVEGHESVLITVGFGEGEANREFNTLELNKEAFDELCGMGYDLKVNYKVEETDEEDTQETV